MESEGSLWCSQEAVTRSRSESVQTSPHPHIIFKIHLIVSSHERLLSGLYASGFATKIQSAFHIYIRVTCPARLAVPDLITLADVEFDKLQ